MMGSEQKRMLLAVSLSAMVLFVWQAYFAPKHVVQDTNLPVAQEKKVVTTETTTRDSVTNNKLDKPLTETFERKVYTLRNNESSFNVSSTAEFLSIENKNALFTFDKAIGSINPFKIMIIDNGKIDNLNFSFNQTSEREIEGVDPRYGVNISLILQDDNFLSLRLSSLKNYRYRFNLEVKEDSINSKPKEYLFYGKDVERIVVGDDESSDLTAKWFGVDYNYHLFAIIFNDPNVVSYQSKNQRLAADLVNPLKNLELKLLYSKKEYDYLKDIGNNLDLSIDFGIFTILALPIFRGLQYLYNFIPNYGIAIILLTIIIRLLTFPLQFKSFKSMKKMQKIQPELTKLREKHKDDPQKMQRETMELFKRAGANPLGGCLPMIAQMPFFFALWQVLSNSVELVGAPFMFWLNDLSAKDPYYILPVLIGLSFILQTKITPSTTVDPMQKKMMMIMPLVFCFIMKDFPAGLTIYIFISTIFGIAQQLFVYKFVD